MSLRATSNSKALCITACRFFMQSTSPQSSYARAPSYYHSLGKKSLVYRTVGQQLEICSQNFSGREAIVSCHENHRLTFKEVLEKTDQLAASFLRIGLQQGDKIGIWAPNYIFWYISSLAAARIGLVTVGINPAYQSAEIDYCIKKANIKAIIAPESYKSTDYYEILKSICPEIIENTPGKINSRSFPNLKSIIIHSDSKLPGTFQYNDLFNFAEKDLVLKVKSRQNLIQPDSPCNIQFTSGTTGLPKAAVISHFSCVNNSIHVAERNELYTKHHRICVHVPLFHASGFIFTVMSATSQGATLVLPAPSFDAKASIDAIVQEKCTVIHGTPTMYVDLIKELTDSKIKLDTPQLAVTGGAACSPKLFQDIKQNLKVKKVKTVYGQTEATAVICQSLHDETEDHLLHTVGQVLDHLELKVIDKAGNVVPFGQPGELCVRGYANCLGYYGDEAKTKELIDQSGWLKTGDQFILYEDGYCKIVGRLKEMVIRGGENIFPKEIEDFLNSHPSILESHVIGVPDERMGEELFAFIRLKSGAPEVNRDDIKKFSEGKIAHFKVPRFIKLVEDFPKTVSGKVQKFKLLEQYTGDISKHDGLMPENQLIGMKS